MLRDFQTYTCSEFSTKELQRETNARNRRDAAKKAAPAKKDDSSSQTPGPQPVTAEGLRDQSLEEEGLKSGEAEIKTGTLGVKNKGKGWRKADEEGKNIMDTSVPKAGRKPKTFNLNTYKHHSLGDYLETIRQRGTTDSFSTESVR